VKSQRRHELKEDELVDSLVQFGEKLKQNQGPIMIGLLLAAVVVAFVAWYLHATMTAADKAWLALAKADAAASQLGSGAEGKGKAEKEKAVYEDYISVVRSYGRTDAAPIAAYKAANCLYEQGKYDEAIEAYREVERRFRRSPVAAFAKHGAGYALEQQGKVEEALKEFREVAESGPKFLAVEAHLDMGRCLEKLGRRAEARRAYESVVREAPGTGLALSAERRIAALAASETTGKKGKESPAPKGGRD